MEPIKLSWFEEVRILNIITGGIAIKIVRHLRRNITSSSRELVREAGRAASASIPRVNRKIQELGFEIVYEDNRFFFKRVIGQRLPKLNLPAILSGQSHRWIIT